MYMSYKCEPISVCSSMLLSSLVDADTIADVLAEKRFNASELLDRLLLGYDSRLHPTFGGENADVWIR